MVAYHDISARDQSILHIFEKKVLLGIFFLICLVCGENLEWRYFGRRHECAKTKTSQEMEMSLRKFQEPSEKSKVIYTANALEFVKACEELSWNDCTSTPHRSELSGIAERAVRRIEGTCAVLLHSGMDEKWWADSTECCYHLRNIQDKLSYGKTHYGRRFGMPFNGPIIPFGAMVE